MILTNELDNLEDGTSNVYIQKNKLVKFVLDTIKQNYCSILVIISQIYVPFKASRCADFSLEKFSYTVWNLAVSFFNKFSHCRSKEKKRIVLHEKARVRHST